MRFAEANTAFFPRVKKKKKRNDPSKISNVLLYYYYYYYCYCSRRSFHSYDDSTRLDSRVFQCPMRA